MFTSVSNRDFQCMVTFFVASQLFKFVCGIVYTFKNELFFVLFFLPGLAFIIFRLLSRPVRD